MSEVVSMELATSSMKRGRKELVSASGVQAWLEKMSSGEGSFTSIVPGRAARRASENNFAVSLVTTSIASTLVGAVTISALPLYGSLNVLEIIGFVAATPLVVTGSAFPFFKRSSSRQKLLWAQLQTVQSAGLAAWLKARYGLEVSEGTLGKVTEKILLGEYPIFADLSGGNWRVERSRVDNTIVVVPFEDAKDREKQVVRVVGRGAEADLVTKVELPGELGSLLAGVESRLSALKLLSLAVESSHVVKRVEEDLRQALLSYRKLDVLGASVEGSGQLAVVLGALSDELRGLVDAEVSAVKADLTVQGNYLKSRHLEASVSSRLSLEAPAVSAVQKVESANV